MHIPFSPSIQFYSSLYLSFSTFHYKYGTFFYAKSHSLILAVYSYCFYCYILTFDRLVSAFQKQDVQETAKMPHEFCRWGARRMNVWVFHDVSNDTSFQFRAVGSQSAVREQSRETQDTMSFWVLACEVGQWPQVEILPCISLLWKKHEEARLSKDVSQEVSCLSLSHTIISTSYK